MAVIGELTVNVVANTLGFGKGLDNARKKLTPFQQSVKQTEQALTFMRRAVVGLSAAFVTGRFVGSLRQAALELDAVGKTADKLGIASENLMGLQHGAELSGVGVDTLNMALQRMTRRVAEAAQGTGEAKGAIAELGLDAKRLVELAPDQVLGRIADAMQGVASDSDRLRLAFKLFDSEGVVLVNMLRDGSKGLQDFQKQAEELGATLTDEEIDKIERMNDAMTSLSKLIGGLKAEIIIDVAPAASEAIEGLQVILKDLRGSGSKLNKTSFGRMAGAAGGLWAWAYRGYQEDLHKGLLGAGVATGLPAVGLSPRQTAAQLPFAATGRRVDVGLEVVSEQLDKLRAGLEKYDALVAEQTSYRNMVKLFTGAAKGSVMATARLLGAGPRALAGQPQVFRNIGQELLKNAWMTPAQIQGRMFEFRAQQVADEEQRWIDKQADLARRAAQQRPVNAAIERGTVEAYRAERLGRQQEKFMQEQLRLDRQRNDALMRILDNRPEVFEMN